MAGPTIVWLRFVRDLPPETPIDEAVVAALLEHWNGSGAAAPRVMAEIEQPAKLPQSPDVMNPDPLPVAITPTIDVVWHENDFQEKVGGYHHAYLRARRDDDTLTVWAADYTGSAGFHAEIDLWLALAGDAPDWVRARRELAAALAREGMRDDSDGCVLPLAMATAPAERDRILAELPGRKPLVSLPDGTVWVGARLPSSDVHFPQHYESAWRERDGRYVEGSWIEHKYKLPADAAPEVRAFFRP